MNKEFSLIDWAAYVFNYDELLEVNLGRWRDKLSDLGFYTHERFFRNLKEFFAHVQNSPDFYEKVRMLTTLRDTVSRRQFIRNHLMSVPEFQALLDLAESEFESAYRQMLQIIRTVSNWVWRRTLTILRKITANPRTTFIPADSEGRKEKLWPLLLAFKNN